MLTFNSRFEVVKYLRENNKDKRPYCYLLSHNNVPFYVGVSANNKRLLEHEKCARPYAKINNVLKARKIRKILREGGVIQYTIVRFFTSRFELISAEKSLVLFYGKKIDRTGILTNILDGGEGTPARPASKKQKEAVRKANLGKVKSELTRQRLSEANKGKPGTFLGCKHSEETKKLMSMNNSAENHPQYGRRGELSHNYGRKHSDETKEKIKHALSNIDLSCTEDRKIQLKNFWNSQPILECPYCGKTSTFKAAMIKHHFENCKQNPKFNGE
jgi:predicted GIY-YIG superfamily endonuclease